MKSLRAAQSNVARGVQRTTVQPINCTMAPDRPVTISSTPKVVVMRPLGKGTTLPTMQAQTIVTIPGKPTDSKVSGKLSNSNGHSYGNGSGYQNSSSVSGNASGVSANRGYGTSSYSNGASTARLPTGVSEPSSVAARISSGASASTSTSSGSSSSRYTSNGAGSNGNSYGSSTNGYSTGSNGTGSTANFVGLNGRKADGLVVQKANLGTYMPAVRAAAAQVVDSRVTGPAPRPTSRTGFESSTSLILDAEFTTPDVVLQEDADFEWAKDNYSSTQRTIDTWTFFTIFRSRLYLLDAKWSYIGGFTEAKKKERTRDLARYLLASVLKLGPTFIKVGQLSSTRSDLFPAEFVEELSTLQDRVPAFSADKAVAIIEAELGQPMSQLFASFDRRPIAAASLGQVHRATLWSGEEVVVKVQRPGLAKLFDIDLENLRVLAEQLDKQDDSRDFKGIYQECAAVLLQEIDYIAEGRNADRFRRNFRDVPWVRVPVVHWGLSSMRVLTLEYLPGVKVSDGPRLAAMGLDLDLIARRATEAYLIQILKHGFFHADPHPGNVAVDPSGGGTLVYYDFGMCGEIVLDVRQRLLDVFAGIYRKDSNLVIRSLIQLKVIKATGDLLSVRRSIAYFLDNITRQAEREETISKIGEDLFAIALDQPFRFPATFTFVLRAFSTLEGIGKTLNPDYKFNTVAAPYATELLSLQDGEKRSTGGLLLEQVQQQASELGSAAAAMPFSIKRINNTLEQLENGDLKLRVRVLEAERAARRSSVLQLATMNTVGAATFLNVGTTLAVNHATGAATFCMLVAGIFAFLTYRGFKRVEKLDKFEKDMRG